MICSKCGSPVDSSSLYCPRCGGTDREEEKFLPAHAAWKKINPHLYTFSLWGGIVCMALGIGAGRSWAMPGLVLGAIGLVCLAVASIYYFKLLYRCWSVLQGHNPRTTPGKAVGYFFIPGFNIFWMFVAIAGLAKDANDYCRQAKSGARISENLSLAACVVSLVPYVNVIAAPVLVNMLVYQWANFLDSAEKIERLSLSFVDLHQYQKRYGWAIAACVLLVFALGFFAAQDMPGFARYRTGGPVAVMQAECEMIKQAEESYHSKHGKYLQTLHPETDLRKQGLGKLTTSAIVLSDGTFYIISMESHKTAKKLRYNSLEGTTQIE